MECFHPACFGVYACEFEAAHPAWQVARREMDSVSYESSCAAAWSGSTKLACGIWPRHSRESARLQQAVMIWFVPVFGVFCFVVVCVALLPLQPPKPAESITRHHMHLAERQAVISLLALKHTRHSFPLCAGG